MRKYTIPTAFTEERIPRSYPGDLTQLNTVIGYALLQETVDNKPLTDWIGDYWGNPRMTPAESQTIMGVTVESPAANLTAGDPNPFFRFIDSVDKSGNMISRGPFTAVLDTVNDDDLAWVDAGRAALLVAAGGDVEGLQVFAKVVPADAVPEGIPGRTGIELNELEEEQEFVKTWGQWKSPNHEFQTIGEDTFISLVYAEKYLKASQWAFISGLEVVTVTEFKELQLQAAAAEDMAEGN